MFQGCMVALVTPFLDNGEVDSPALMDLVEWQIAAKTDGLVILGTTGEAATITNDERQRILSDVVKQVAGRVPVIAGTGTNGTASTIALTQQAKDIGVDAALIVTPYYNKPTQQGLISHFSNIAQAVDIPQIIYNVPARTACDLLPQSVLRLAKWPNIVAIKEATGQIDRLAVLKESGLSLLSGDDGSTLDFIRAGGQGVISVIANVMPGVFGTLCHHALAGRWQQAEQLQGRLLKMYELLFIESNPIPVKWLLHHMGKIHNQLRLPLTVLDPQYQAPLAELMQSYEKQLTELKTL